MNFLLFTLEYPPFKGGVANYYKNLSKYWPDNNFYVLANIQKGKKNKNKITFKPLLVKFIFPKWILGFYFLTKEIKKNKINHVLVGHILPLGTIVYILAKFLNFKYTVIMHGMDFQFAMKNKRKRYLVKKILENADLIICANNYLAHLVKTQYNLKNIKVVNPGISKHIIQKNTQNIENITKKYNLKNRKILLTIGRLVKRKGIDRVIEILPNLLQKYPNLIYIIIGNGPDENYLKNKAKKLRKNILFLKNVDNTEKWSWLQVGDIFIMPSRDIKGDFEGFGIVYLEANLAKIPVIAGNSGGVNDAIKHNYNGLLIDPNNTTEIKNAIIKLFENKKLRDKLCYNGYKEVKNKFEVKKQVKKIYDFYNNSSL